jgi:hypothetical protein
MKTLASLVIVAVSWEDAAATMAADRRSARSVASGAACTLPGLACASATELCHCIAPENTWLCCPQTVDINCVKTPPFDRVGQQCCPTGVRYGCAVCHADASREEVTCSDSDPHWRLATTTCAPPSSDAGAE